MLCIRALIPAALNYGFSKACMIITRYSLVRTQFKDGNGKEIPILNYQLQQEKVIPRIAETFAGFFASETINELASQIFNEAKNEGKFDKLNEGHAVTSGAKAILTN